MAEVVAKLHPDFDPDHFEGLGEIIQAMTVFALRDAGLNSSTETVGMEYRQLQKGSRPLAVVAADVALFEDELPRTNWRPSRQVEGLLVRVPAANPNAPFLRPSDPNYGFHMAGLAHYLAGLIGNAKYFGLPEMQAYDGRLLHVRLEPKWGTGESDLWPRGRAPRPDDDPRPGATKRPPRRVA